MKRMDPILIPPDIFKGHYPAPDPVAFGRRLKALCQAHFDNDIIACAVFGYSSPGQLRRHQSGDQLPTGRALYPLAMAGFNVNWLLTGRGAIYDQTPEGIALAEAGIIVHVPDRDR